MRAQYAQCEVCFEFVHSSTFISIAPICEACKADTEASARIQRRIEKLYESLVAHIANLSDADSERYHNVWLAQLDLARPPRVISPHEDDKRAEANRRDLLYKKLRTTMMRGDAVSTCMKIAQDLKAALDIQRCLLLKDYDRSLNNE